MIPENVFIAPFTVQERMTILGMIKTMGIKKTEVELMKMYHPSVAKAVIKNTCRNYGW
jgi:hypothetical protein